jgi:hypothetical protein
MELEKDNPKGGELIAALNHRPILAVTRDLAAVSYELSNTSHLAARHHGTGIGYNIGKSRSRPIRAPAGRRRILDPPVRVPQE